MVENHNSDQLKVDLRSICFLSAFGRLFFSIKKYALFRPHFYMSISALTRVSHSGQKLSENIICKGVQLCFKMSLFQPNYYHYETFYLLENELIKMGTKKSILFKEPRTYFFTNQKCKKGQKTNAV